MLGALGFRYALCIEFLRNDFRVEYPIPTRGAYPRFVGVDAKGRVWFAEWWSRKLGMVDPEGSQQLAS